MESERNREGEVAGPPDNTSLAKIQRYEAHLSRQFYQALHEAVDRPCLAAPHPSRPPDWPLTSQDSALRPHFQGLRPLLTSPRPSIIVADEIVWLVRTASETSQGEPCILPLVPAGITNARVRMTVGPPHPWLGYPTAPAFYWDPVRRVRVSPSASFRSHLAVGALAWLAVPAITARSGLSPPRCLTCLAHKKVPWRKFPPRHFSVYCWAPANSRSLIRQRRCLALSEEVGFIFLRKMLAKTTVRY